MSFFTDLKEDLAQAVDELIPDGQATAEGEETETFDEEQMVNTLDGEGEATYDLPDDDEMEEALLAQLLEEEESEEEETEDEEEEESVLASKEPAGDVTVITKGTIINGSIVSDGSLEINGLVNGDIECLGKLTVSGAVKGNSSAAEVFVNASRHEGGISSKGCVKIGVGTVVVGDITASSSVIAGAVKGQIDVNGPVIVDSTAIIKGNINAKAVQINNGAVLEGFCSLSYSDVDIDTFFDAE